MSLNLDDVRGMAEYARIALTDEELVEMTAYLNDTIDNVLAPIRAYDLILNKRTLIGSAGGTNEDIEALLQLIASGKLVPNIEEISFDEIPAGLERLRKGGLLKRLVAVM